MKFKILLSTLYFFVLSFSLFAKPVIDSVGVKNVNGKKVILFKVRPSDTYYSIGRRYNVKPLVIMKFNGSKKETLTIGNIVKVPTGEPYKLTAKNKKETLKEKKERLAEERREAKKHRHADENVQDSLPEKQVVQPVVPQPAPVIQLQPHDSNTPSTQYKISAGETLYSIAKRFNTSVDEINKLNNFTSTILTPGEIILVKAGVTGQQTVAVPAVHYETEVVKRDSTVVAPVVNPTKDSSAERRFNANRFGLYEKNEKGVATWMDDTSLDPNKKLVLHRTAPIGTVIKITNPMTNRTTFAKVVGRFTDNESTKDVIIVMTKNVADALGALDKRFHVNISYGSPNE